jgi:aminoglycoside phosphotransferase family enzyme/predicted kinase
MAAVSIPDRTHEERAALVAALSSPHAYAHAVELSIQVIETHISHLFLTAQFAYKVKKPVDLGFVNYSTLALRRRYTELEHDLNSRISPDVFLGVEPVTARPNGGFKVGGDGEPVEFALKMRQLPADRTFSALLRADEIGPEETSGVAHLVARFHSDADVVPSSSALGGIHAMKAVTDDNLSVIARFSGVTCDGDNLDDVTAYTSAFLDVKGDLMESRKARGYVRDCHGFIDVASDLSFLATDLIHSGRQDLANVLVDKYVSETGDEELRSLAPFYLMHRMHRACVRCKVTSLLLDDIADQDASRSTEVIEDASSYGRLAAEVVASQRPQAVYLMAGLVCSGKSTMADELARRWDIDRFSADVVRKKLAGLDPERVSNEVVRDDLYAKQMSDLTYAEMIRLGAEALSNGRSVVLDAAFIKRQHRDDAVTMARAHGVPVYIVETRAPESIALTRLFPPPLDVRDAAVQRIP